MVGCLSASNDAITQYQKASNLSKIKVCLAYGAEVWEGQDQLATSGEILVWRHFLESPTVAYGKTDNSSLGLFFYKKSQSPWIRTPPLCLI